MLYNKGEKRDSMGEGRYLETERDQKGFGRGRYPLHLEEEDFEHILLALGYIGASC